jgi:hypothetical protein
MYTYVCRYNTKIPSSGHIEILKETTHKFKENEWTAVGRKGEWFMYSTPTHTQTVYIETST